MQSEQAGPWQAENMDGRPIDEAEFNRLLSLASVTIP